jgi:hypothetical protein
VLYRRDSFAGEYALRTIFSRPLIFSLSNGGQRPNPVTGPDLATTAASVCFMRACDEACRDALERFRQGTFSWILIEDLFSAASLPNTPVTFAPLPSSEWWTGAYAALATIDAIKHRPVAYRSENSGHLFVNFGSLGGCRTAGGESAGWNAWSHRCLQFPVSSEFRAGQIISPSPDLVVLIRTQTAEVLGACFLFSNVSCRSPANREVYRQRRRYPRHLRAGRCSRDCKSGAI